MKMLLWIYTVNFIIALSIILSPQTVHARWSLISRFFVEELYDDNLFLTEKDEQDDIATVVSPGIDLKYESPKALVDLDYQFKRFFYYEFTELDYFDHRGALKARADLTPWFSLGVNENLIVSEDPIELTGAAQFESPSIRVGERNRYTRNIVEPEAIFRFGEKSSISLGYRNQILRNSAEDVADQDENVGNILINYRANIHNGLEIFYEHMDQDFGSVTPPEPPRDFKADVTRGRYTYFFDPITSVFVEYGFVQKDLNRETAGFPDYKVHSPKFGFSRDIHENLSWTVSMGYLLRTADERSNKEAFYGLLDFSGEYKRLSATVYGETGFRDDYSSAESLGFYEFWQTGLDVGYQLHERLNLEGFLYIEKEKFTDINREDKYYNARVRLNYQPLEWLLLSFDYEFNERDSSASLESFTRNTYFFRITLQHDIAERFQ
jgi:hypothetical protein